MKRKVLLVSILILIVLSTEQTLVIPVATQPSADSTSTRQGSPEVNTALSPVIRVIDGDTIVVEINGEQEKIRLIGVDTPEVVDPRKPVQCFGKEASAFTKELLANRSIRIETDPTQGDRDRYSRLIRYVFLEDGTLVNKLIIAEGYGHEYTYHIPYRYQSDFKAAEKTAREQQKGLWAPNACTET